MLDRAQVKPFARLGNPIVVDDLKPGESRSFDVETGDGKMIYVQSKGLLDTSASSGTKPINIFFDGQFSIIDANRSHVFFELGN